MKKYGISYKGSKSAIAEWVIEHLPRSDVFVDLLAGGCAITHAAILSGKYKRFIVNDISDIPLLFINAIQGKYKDEKRWISYEDFHKYKSTDPYIRICWSFGNNGIDYLYSRKLEPFKKALHQLCFSQSPHEIRLAWRDVAKEFYLLCTEEVRTNPVSQSRLPESLSRLQSLERLENIQGLAKVLNTQYIKVFQKDYREIDIPPDAVVYCDPPYISTDVEYGKNFNHKDFYKWLRYVPFPVYISEYEMPDDFIEIDNIGKRCSMSATNKSLMTTERLFIHERWADNIQKREAI